MSNMIKKVSRDHENYEVNSADKIMVYNRLRGRGWLIDMSILWMIFF